MSEGCQHLFVIWREPDEGRRHVIGELWQDHEGFAFGYGHDVEAARARGFSLLVELPAYRPVSDPYRSSYLFSTFAQRIPSPKRPDYKDILESWGVTAPDSPLDILARSGGVQLTDRIEVDEYRSADDALEIPLLFRVAGEEHYPGSSIVEVGEELQLVREPTNDYDANAVMVQKSDGTKLGYVPRQYSELVARLVGQGLALHPVAERRLVTSNDRARWIVKISRH
ncbi:MAG: HIRAN domain-containing protein [Polyangiaceae bacterium]